MSSSSSPVPLTMAVVLFDLVQPLDFVGPCDLLTPLQPSRLAESNSLELTPHSLTIAYLAPTLEPITMAGGLQVVPTMTFDEADSKEWDVILVPGGRGARPWLETNHRAREWLSAGHVEKAKWVLTVCTGSWLLSSTGLLSGHRVTTNKVAYTKCVEWAQTHQPDVEWVPKARWVRSGKFWTSSGVTAGMDLIQAWMDEVVGKQIGLKIRGVLEFSGKDDGDDEWAEYYGLV